MGQKDTFEDRNLFSSWQSEGVNFGIKARIFWSEYPESDWKVLMQSDDDFAICDVDDLFLIESDWWKDTDLFAVKIDKLILKGYEKFFLNGFLEFFKIGSLREFHFEGFGMGGSEVDFNGFGIF